MRELLLLTLLMLGLVGCAPKDSTKFKATNISSDESLLVADECVPEEYTVIECNDEAYASFDTQLELEDLLYTNEEARCVTLDDELFYEGYDPTLECMTCVTSVKMTECPDDGGGTDGGGTDGGGTDGGGTDGGGTDGGGTDGGGTDGGGTDGGGTDGGGTDGGGTDGGGTDGGGTDGGGTDGGGTDGGGTDGGGTDGGGTDGGGTDGGGTDGGGTDGGSCTPNIVTYIQCNNDIHSEYDQFDNLEALLDQAFSTEEGTCIKLDGEEVYEGFVTCRTCISCITVTEDLNNCDDDGNSCNGNGHNNGHGNNGHGHSNNGHGNNQDGVDVSNPGQGHGGPNGQDDPSGEEDDENGHGNGHGRGH